MVHDLGILGRVLTDCRWVVEEQAPLLVQLVLHWFIEVGISTSAGTWGSVVRGSGTSSERGFYCTSTHSPVGRV